MHRHELPARGVEAGSGENYEEEGRPVPEPAYPFETYAAVRDATPLKPGALFARTA